MAPPNVHALIPRTYVLSYKGEKKNLCVVSKGVN